MTGATGTAATIAVGTVTTGQPGTQATVTNSGNAANAIFDFVLPQVETGSFQTQTLALLDASSKNLSMTEASLCIFRLA